MEPRELVHRQMRGRVVATQSTVGPSQDAQITAGDGAWDPWKGDLAGRGSSRRVEEVEARRGAEELRRGVPFSSLVFLVLHLAFSLVVHDPVMVLGH